MQTFLELIRKPIMPAAREMYELYWEEVINHIVAFPYVKRLFAALKERKIIIAFLSDMTAYIQYRKIESLGVECYCDYLVTSEEAGKEKPSSDMFSLICDKIKCNTKEILMVGDSLEKDIVGANQFGMSSLQFCKEFADDMDMRVLRCL